jgi:hypothetical protein
MMEISWFKVGSFEEGYRRIGTRSLIPAGDVEIMAGSKKAVKWAL